MKRLLLILALVVSAATVAQAQYVRVNIDRQTVAAMTAAYGTEAFAEKYYNEQTGKILDRYRSAEVVAAAIFASKYLDRKALTTLGIWGDGTENYYYRRIYNLVGSKIMPKIWTVAGMMLHSPQTAVYWGSYLMKVCDETKNLCYQFESVVTNSRLSFRDIAFLTLNSEVARLLDLTKIGNVDWRLMLDDFASIPGNFTKEQLIGDLDRLYSMASQIVAGGAGNAVDAVRNQSQFHSLFSGKLTSIIDIIDHYETFYSSLDRSVGNTLLGLVGGPDNVARLFDLGNYDLSAWVTDYASAADNTYYTQRWYIYWRDAGSETLCNYAPPTDDNSILYGTEWTRFTTTDSGFYPSAAQRESVLLNSESHAGWSRTKVSQMNAANDGYTYAFSSSIFGYILSRSGRQYAKAYAYAIQVTRSWSHSEEVYEEVFDSYTMDLATFRRQMTARLSDLNDNEDGRTYYIGYDDRRYYTASDAAKLAGCETVIITATCHDGAELGSGSTQYKCGQCGSSVNSHTRECAMRTSVSESGVDTSELDAAESEARSQIALIEAQISQLEQRNNELVRLISNASIEQAATYRQEYNANKDKITALKAELSTWQQKLNDILAAKAEAEDGEAVTTDDWQRIPAIMNELKSAYSLTWSDTGSWSGNTFTRHGTAQHINGTLTFSATLSIARKPKYFLGIKIHRAIVQITWKLTGEYSDSQVVDILELNPSASDADKQRIVNQHISQAAQDYPGCDITTEYVKSEPPVANTTEDCYHLLWASDRLDIARQVETRLTSIYADLVSLEKMMTYKLSIIDVLKGVAPYVNTTQGKKLDAIEQSYERWRRSARLQEGGDR